MRPTIVLLSVLLIIACSTAPAPSGPPVAPAPPAPTAHVSEEATVRTVYVNASALNVRSEPTADSELVGQVKRGAALAVLGEREGWVNVRLEDGREGWVAERFVSAERAVEQARRATPRRKRGGGCESDYAFVETPTLGMTDRDAPGLVVVEATVNTKGVVTGTKVITNTTGDPGAGAVAEREIRSAKFAPPIRNCQPRSFIFTYRRTF